MDEKDRRLVKETQKALMDTLEKLALAGTPQGPTTQELFQKLGVVTFWLEKASEMPLPDDSRELLRRDLAELQGRPQATLH